VVNFSMHVGYINSQHKDDKSPLKGAWSGSRDPHSDAPNDVSGTVEARIINFACR